jgi:hypothetical protein
MTNIPDHLRSLSSTIEESRYILDLRKGWDDGGSLMVTEQTWKRATGFLEKLTERLWSEKKLLMVMPSIMQGPNGSIDLHWETDEYELLINVPGDPMM